MTKEFPPLFLDPDLSLKSKESQAAWETNVFIAATHFRVHSPGEPRIFIGGPDKPDYETPNFFLAVKKAKWILDHVRRRALIYAIAPMGEAPQSAQSTMLPRELWLGLAHVWAEEHPEHMAELMEETDAET